MIGLLIFMAFFCCGLKLITHKDHGFIFDFVGIWCDSLSTKAQTAAHPFHKAKRIFYNTLDFAFKPIIGCVTCMASVWGTIGYFLFRNESISEWVFFCIALSFANTILYELYFHYSTINDEIIQKKNLN